MASSKSPSFSPALAPPKRSTFGRLASFYREKGDKVSEVTIVVEEAHDAVSSSSGTGTPSSSVSDLGISKTPSASGSLHRRATLVGNKGRKGGGEEKNKRGKLRKTAKLERRKSVMNVITSFFPKLTPQPADPTSIPCAHPHHQRHQLPPQSPPPQRKPVPGPQPLPSASYWHPVTPVYIVPLVPQNARPAVAPTFPPAPSHQPPPPPLPPKEPHSHSRNASLPVTAMLRKDPKPAGSTSLAPPSHMQSHHQRGRSESPPVRPGNAARLQPNRLQPGHPAPAHRGRSSSANPPINRSSANEPPRPVSNPANLIPPSSASSDGGDSPSSKSKRRSWLHGGRSRSDSSDFDEQSRAGAWIMTPSGRADYNASILANGEKVPELWSEAGTILVYLHPKTRGLGPSFKVPDHILASSTVLTECLISQNMADSSLLSPDDTGRQSSSNPPAPREHRLYLPLANTDLETLVVARNLLAFLTNQPLVGTKASPNVFTALLRVADLLRGFQFTSYDGFSFGPEVDAAFDLLVDQFDIADVRDSSEKTIQGLILAEQMRSLNLYNETFTHAVGKYDDLLNLDSPLFNNISLGTRNRIERANFDLVSRVNNVSSRLESFEFPSLFAGIASSTSHEEYKAVRFKEWRNSFGKMRSFVLSYYKDLFGHWPPKAKSKKNQFSRGGLNRQALKILYWDLCSLYDLLVDRESKTTRAIDDMLSEEENDDMPSNPSISALRRMLTEFDHSSPPVLPPMPYDVPKLPSMTAIHENYNTLPSKTQAKFDKHLQSNELLLMLIKSRNADTDALQRPFLNAFKEFEQKEARAVHPQEIADQRIGHWLFLYVVLQSLPMLVVDAPDLKWTDGVEYFLCQAPQGNPPWADDAGEVRRQWYRAAGQNLVALSTDVIMFSVEGIYTRSHCWTAAKRWDPASRPTTSGESIAPTLDESVLDLDGPSPLVPPRAVFQDMDPVTNPVTGRASPKSGSPSGSPQIRPRNASGPQQGRGGQHAYRWSVSMGLEPISMGDEGVSRAMSGAPSHGSRQSSISGLEALGAVHPRPGSSHLSNGHRQTGSESSPAPGQGESTFDDILKGMEKEKGKKKRSFF